MPEQGSSFIPKSGVKTVQRVSSTRRIYLLAYISYIIFFSTLFVVIGVYIYGATVTRSLTTLKDQLVAERQRFDISDIDNIKLLDKRLSTAKTLLNESTAPSRIFSDVESIVASNIYFSGMSYRQLPNRQFQINLVGRAGDFNQIIAQERLVENGTILRNAKVVDYDYSIGEGTGGNLLGNSTLTFVFSDTRDLSAIAYTPSASAGGFESAVSGENVILQDSLTADTDTAGGVEDESVEVSGIDETEVDDGGGS